MYDIDIHILVSKKDLKYLGSMLDSLKDEPINIYLSPSIPNNIGLARANAFKKGNAKWVSWADADDTIIPGSYRKLLNATMQHGADMLWMAENVFSVDGRLVDIRQSPHHMLIAKRERVIERLDELAALKVYCEAPIHYLPNRYFLNDVGYNYILRTDSTVNTIDQKTLRDEAERVRSIYDPNYKPRQLR